jgi:hypothetical protein
VSSALGLSGTSIIFTAHQDTSRKGPFSPAEGAAEPARVSAPLRPLTRTIRLTVKMSWLINLSTLEQPSLKLHSSSAQLSSNSTVENCRSPGHLAADPTPLQP